MANKRYYWLKLKDNFFESDEIKVVEAQKNGEAYIVFWLKLLLKSISQSDIGVLLFKKDIPYNPELLATVTATNIDIVKGALIVFRKLGMLEMKENGEIYIDSIQDMLGSETDSARRVRKHRDNKDKLYALHCNDMKQISNTELELDKEIDKDKEKKETPAPTAPTAPPTPAGCSIFKSKANSPLTRACGLFKARSWCFQDKAACQIWDIFNAAVKHLEELGIDPKKEYGALQNQVKQRMDKDAERLSSWANKMHTGE